MHVNFRRAFGLMTLILLGLGLLPSGHAQIKIVDSGPCPVPVKIAGGTVTGFNRRISLSGGGPVAYGFDYRYVELPKSGAQTNGPKVMPAQAFPRIGDVTAGTSGLGLTGGAWYWNGFFGVQAGSQNHLVRTVAESLRAYTNTDCAVVDAEWRPA